MKVLEHFGTRGLKKSLQSFLSDALSPKCPSTPRPESFDSFVNNRALPQKVILGDMMSKTSKCLNIPYITDMSRPKRLSSFCE